MMRLLEENYDREIHGLLKFGHDAFGNKVEAEEGYRLLHHLERAQIGDRVFDIYNGWQEADDYDARNKNYANCGGRWTVWERKADVY